MTKGPKFALGDDVFARDPQRFIPECTCIVGEIDYYELIDGAYVYEFNASVGIVGGGRSERVSMKEADIHHRIGTPLSQLSGRPGHPGYNEFCRIARSWGYD